MPFRGPRAGGNVGRAPVVRPRTRRPQATCETHRRGNLGPSSAGKEGVTRTGAVINGPFASRRATPNDRGEEGRGVREHPPLAGARRVVHASNSPGVAHRRNGRKGRYFFFFWPFFGIFLCLPGRRPSVVVPMEVPLFQQRTRARVFPRSKRFRRRSTRRQRWPGPRSTERSKGIPPRPRALGPSTRIPFSPDEARRVHDGMALERTPERMGTSSRRTGRESRSGPEVIPRSQTR